VKEEILSTGQQKIFLNTGEDFVKKYWWDGTVITEL
jgi:hypothetical protein